MRLKVENTNLYCKLFELLNKYITTEMKKQIYINKPLEMSLQMTWKFRFVMFFHIFVSL